MNKGIDIGFFIELSTDHKVCPDYTVVQLIVDHEVVMSITPDLRESFSEAETVFLDWYREEVLKKGLLQPVRFNAPSIFFEPYNQEKLCEHLLGGERCDDPELF